MLASDEINYTLIDINGDEYNMVIKAKEKAKYDLDHLATSRAITKLKRAGQKPINRALEKEESAELRSPSSKKPKAQQKQRKSKKLDVKQPVRKVVFPSTAEVPVVEKQSAEAAGFHPTAESTMVANDTAKVVSDLNMSFDMSLILNQDDDFDGVKPLAADVENIPLIQADDNEDLEVIVLPGQNVGGDMPMHSTWFDPHACHTFLNHMGKNLALFKESGRNKKKAAYIKVCEDMRKDGFYFTPDQLEKRKRGLDAQFCYYKKKTQQQQDEWGYYKALHFISVGIWPPGFVSKPKPKIHCNDKADDEGAVGGHTTEDDEQQCAPEGEANNDWGTLGCGNDIYDEITTAPGCNNYEENTVTFNILEEGLGKEWATHEADKALLEEVHECKDFYVNRPLVKNTDLFKKVAEKLADRQYYVDMNTAMTRYKTLISKFNEENDKLKGTGAGKCKWELFDIIYELEKDSVTTKPKITVSAGAKNCMTKAKECVESLAAGRKRAPNDTRQKRVNKLMGRDEQGPSAPMGQKNRALMLAERKLEMEMEYLEEFRGFRRDANARSQNFRDALKLLSELKSTNKDQNNN